MAKTIIVSNRLPISVHWEEGQFTFLPSAGGLATGLKSLHDSGDVTWIGWPGRTFAPDEDTSEVTERLREEHLLPVYISAEDYEDFYEGFSNKTVWPLFHYFQQYTEYNARYWEVYQKVNQQFSQEVLRIAEPGDRIWVHDYQLMLLPQMIREQVPDTTIGFFLHIPFPSYEIFRTLPWRKEILWGIIGSDFVGFHTYDYVRHFLSALSRILELEHSLGRVQLPGRVVDVDALPMGIDYEKYENAVKEPETIAEVIKFRQQIGQEKIILSIDRLDYSKGILQRLEAFELFLDAYPEWQHRVSLIMVLVPSRAGVDQYQSLKTHIDETVGRINGKYNTIDWRPIYYFYRALDFHTLSALYYLSEVALVTPFRDGMNLVAKEYLASKIDKKGVLILSEMAGAAKELTGAVLVNPNDSHAIVEALHEALAMPVEEQKRRNEPMQKNLARYNVSHWAQTFLKSMEDTRQAVLQLREKYFSDPVQRRIFSDYQAANQRLLLLDYDGTLVNFVTDPLEAAPGEQVTTLVGQLAGDVGNQVVIISGRDRKFLNQWFGSLPVNLIAEHGVWRKERDGEWQQFGDLSQEWKPEINGLMETFVDRTANSFIENKDYSLAWHYRASDPELANIRVRELLDGLSKLIGRHQLQILEGSKVIEVKSQTINKGKAVRDWIGSQPQSRDFVLAIGDDQTDEDTFKALDRSAYTLKVGYRPTAARYHIASVKDVLALLAQLAGEPKLKMERARD
ncbi:MAG: bifunctional alpha,alpha-trehalose-phosphate synthase (UDP-forming)/trehalose-phosphatase [Ferruginibacter sp.]|nr:bifunctional alpha,alpha-trehalose-phosphate synthase (UDP-forming)/trehalose-phosphatase [Cytophagales bacterium]